MEETIAMNRRSPKRGFPVPRELDDRMIPLLQKIAG